MKKRLYKSRTDKKLTGVCGGIGKYFGIDPTFIRIAWVVFCLAGGSGVFAYIIAAVVMPEEPIEDIKEQKIENIENIIEAEKVEEQ
ncbi:PspC domain-containing protein [Leptotrichia sp. OH3620_COT-345]|uniref:PspC domain-containing protein n=1 Tax=Leptotrichia sp. OH3620_COT-345 TaxID=2491048 RepID=UPI000F656008|nr:PspC domain-containing protein [Leptotrichia sp. OH3620_COT-345]RRD38088.1 PspC domain-containing protein [Leptotrichia sp. OH3620_COT-345]